MADRNGTCSENGCRSAVHARGLCKAHYSAWYRDANARKVEQYNAKRRSSHRCVSPGCDRQTTQQLCFQHRPKALKQHQHTCRICQQAFSGHHNRKVCDDCLRCSNCKSIQRHGSWQADGRRLCRDCKDREQAAIRTIKQGINQTHRCQAPGCTTRTYGQAIFCRRHDQRCLAVADELDLIKAISWLDVLKHDVCVYCGSPPATIDHIDPIGRGGSRTADNCAPACNSCNGRKSDLKLLPALLALQLADEMAPLKAEMKNVWSTRDLTRTSLDKAAA